MRSYDEDWRAIEGFKDYAVSNTGRVISYKRGYWNELKPQLDTDGYLQVCLFRNNKRHLRFVHVLVAKAFIPCPEGMYEVNHDNGIKTDNCVENLIWTNRRGNMLHAHDTGLIKSRTPIIVTDTQTGKRFIFNGQHEAAIALGINQGNINHALKGRLQTYHGYIFEYIRKEDE